MSSTSKSFLIKDILSENSPSTSSDDESDDTKDMFLSKPIDLRRYFKHPLCPVPLRPSSLLRTKPTGTYRNAQLRENDLHNSPLNALFEMTKKTFDDSDISKFEQYVTDQQFIEELMIDEHTHNKTKIVIFIYTNNSRRIVKFLCRTRSSLYVTVDMSMYPICSSLKRLECRRLI
jgi:hypothetical protein